MGINGRSGLTSLAFIGIHAGIGLSNGHNKKPRHPATGKDTTAMTVERMNTAQTQLAPENGPAGILPSHTLAALLDAHVIQTRDDVEPGQIQPSSLDLRLGHVAHRVRASFLPGKARTVRERLEDLSLHTIDLKAGAVLETGCVYVVPLLESVDLPPTLSGMANPKSSTGRLDVFTRLITDRSTAFDRVEAGYCGPLYAEISPRTFSILARTGSRLNQLRLRQGQPLFSDTQLRDLHRQSSLVEGQGDIDDGIGFSIDLLGDGDTGLIGYRAKRHAGLIDIDHKAGYHPEDFWERLYASRDRSLILDPDEFYILASKEAVSVPPDFAAEMVPFNPEVGEFRVHYAGFFDPGFGHSDSGGQGSRAVLEIRSHDVPFILTDGQLIGRLVYERLVETPNVVYGQGIGSNYQSQGLKLSKHFLDWS